MQVKGIAAPVEREVTGVWADVGAVAALMSRLEKRQMVSLWLSG
jgi:hypothetical protein